MNPHRVKSLSRQATSAIVAFLTVVSLCLPTAQAQAQKTKEAPQASNYSEPEKEGSITEPLGRDYTAPKGLNPQLTRITFYRPAHGFAPGVAHIEINGHYHTSLQLGSYSEICLQPNAIELAAFMVQNGTEPKNYKDATTTLKPEAAQNLYVRVFEYGDGRATLTRVRDEVALSELKETRRQLHAVTRVEQAKECLEEQPKPKAIKKESIVLGADALFAFGKSDAKGISAKGRDALDELIARLQKEYGSNDSALIQITGHADPLGSPAANKRLSEARAMAIRSYFIQGGMSAKRITGEGVGAEQPVITTCGKTATPESIECNKPNRRVVVNVQVTAR
jgi:outer membrane protein OmpA-like peptidoglycan-associated protein